MPKVSVIIPVYNVAPYLRQGLDSVVNQTLRDIEAVCVDDGSTDGSAAILAEYAARDARIRVISIPNSGTVVARKCAVAAAAGEWCLFLDPDDWIEADTCERMVSAATASGVDIVQCGFVLEESFPRSAAERDRSEMYFNRPAGTCRGEDLFEAVYLKRRLGWNLIGRMVRTEVCKAAFAAQAKARSIHETDVYATFHIIARAQRLEVVSDRLYHYRYGVGISTKRHMTLAEYKGTLGKFDAYDELDAFAAKGYAEGSTARRAAWAAGEMMARNSFMSLRRLEAATDRVAGFGMLCEKCGARRLAALLADAFGDPPYPLAMELDGLGVFRGRIVPPSVRKVGIYYFHLTMGGVQRMIVREIELLRARGVGVVLFVDEGAPVELEIPDGVSLVRLPPLMGTRPARPSARIGALCDALLRHRVDVFHSHQYLTNRMIWDILACKFVCGIPFYLHYHSMRTAAIWAQPALSTYVNEPTWLRACDGVFALGGMDASVLAAEGVRAFRLHNPPTDRAEAALAGPMPETSGRLVVWVGRLSPEKHPGDAIRIFGRLHRLDAGLRFALAGGGSPTAFADLKELARQEGIDDALEMPGSVDDLAPYYSRACALLQTSDYEGYSLVAVEALAGGVPVVCYSQPNSPVFADNEAVVQVAPRDMDAAARAVVSLLARTDLQTVRARGRESVRRLFDFDFAGTLFAVFAGGGTPAGLPDGATTAMYLDLQRRALADMHRRQKVRPESADGASLMAQLMKYRRKDGAWLRENADRIRRSAYFDKNWYLAANRDVAEKKIDPAIHYLAHGGYERRDPSPRFSSAEYLEMNPDVARAGMNPLFHFEKSGRDEGRVVVPSKCAGEHNAFRYDTAKVAFSVIMATYNRSHCICDAVDSLFAGRHANFELIVVDDGSTDGTVRLLENRYAGEIAAGRLVVVRSEHVGVCRARNIGLARARNEWVAYLDSDNTVRPGFLEVFAHAVVENPERRSFYASFWLRGAGRIVGRPFDWNRLLQRNFIDLGVYVHNIGLSRELGGFDETMTRLVDWEMILRHSQKFPPRFLGAVVMDYDDAKGADRLSTMIDRSKNLEYIQRRFGGGC